MSKELRTIVAVVGVVGLVVGQGTTLLAGQNTVPPSGRTWVAVLTSIDADAGTASFRARASVAAARSAEKLVAGEHVRFRWEGPERRRVHRIAEVTPLATSRGTPKAATSRGRFAMNAAFVSVNRRTRMITFSIPAGPNWLAALEDVEASEWLAIRCDIDQQGQITALLSVDTLRPTARE